MEIGYRKKREEGRDLGHGVIELLNKKKKKKRVS